MPSLGAVVRQIRKRRGETLTGFGAILGVSASSVSQYEAEKIVPREGILLQLLQLTDSDLERSAILQTLGISSGLAGAANKEQLIAACEDLQEYLEMVQREGIPEVDITSRNAKEEFAKEASAILGGQSIKPVIAKILKGWRQYGHLNGAEKIFDDALAYLTVQLKLLEGREVRQRSAAGHKGDKKA